MPQYTPTLFNKHGKTQIVQHILIHLKLQQDETPNPRQLRVKTDFLTLQDGGGGGIRSR